MEFVGGIDNGMVSTCECKKRGAMYEISYSAWHLEQKYSILFLNEWLWRFGENAIFLWWGGLFSSCGLDDFGRFSIVAVT